MLGAFSFKAFAIKRSSMNRLSQVSSASGNPPMPPPGREQPAPAAGPSVSCTEAGCHAASLRQLSGAGDEAFDRPMSPADFTREVAGLSHAAPGEFGAAATRIARALAIDLPLPRLSLQQRDSIVSRMNGRPPKPVSAEELVCLLDMAGREPGRFSLNPLARGVWQDCLWRAVKARAAIQPAVVGLLLPRLQESVRRSALWIELQGQPHALAAVLSYSYGGALCRQAEQYDFLCDWLTVQIGDRSAAAACLKDMLLDALTAGLDPADATAVRSSVERAKAALGSGSMVYTNFKSAMKTAMERLVARLQHVALPDRHADLRKHLARYGITPAHDIVPARSAEGFHRGRLLLTIAASTEVLCRKLHRMPPADIGGTVAEAAVLWLENFCRVPAPASNCAADLLDLKLLVFSRDVATVRAAVDAAVKVSNLVRFKAKIVRATMAQATDSWLADRRWGGVLVDFDSPRAVIHKEVAERWRQQLKTWRSEPDARDAMLENPDQILPESLGAMLADAERFPPAGVHGRAALEPVKKELTALFDRCMSSMAIEGFQREALAEVFADAIDDALDEWVDTDDAYTEDVERAVH